MKNGTDALELYVSFKNQPFVIAQFPTNLKRTEYHIADVSNDRVFVAVAHSKTSVNLYISKIISDREAKFVLSLENIMTYFPNNTWNNTWLT